MLFLTTFRHYSLLFASIIADREWNNIFIQNNHFDVAIVYRIAKVLPVQVQIKLCAIWSDLCLIVICNFCYLKCNIFAPFGYFYLI